MVAHTKHLTDEERHQASLRAKRKHYHANLEEQRKKARECMSRLRAAKREGGIPTAREVAASPSTATNRTPNMELSEAEIQACTIEELQTLVTGLWTRTPFNLLVVRPGTSSANDTAEDWIAALITAAQKAGVKTVHQLFASRRLAINVTWDLLEPLQVEISRRDPKRESPLYASCANVRNELCHAEILVDEIEGVLLKSILEGLKLWKDRRACGDGIGWRLGSDDNEGK